jgi:hypothetical protein
MAPARQAMAPVRDQETNCILSVFIPNIEASIGSSEVARIAIPKLVFVNRKWRLITVTTHTANDIGKIP